MWYNKNVLWVKGEFLSDWLTEHSNNAHFPLKYTTLWMCVVFIGFIVWTDVHWSSGWVSGALWSLLILVQWMDWYKKYLLVFPIAQFSENVSCTLSNPCLTLQCTYKQDWVRTNIFFSPAFFFCIQWKSNLSFQNASFTWHVSLMWMHYHAWLILLRRLHKILKDDCEQLFYFGWNINKDK